MKVVSSLRLVCSLRWLVTTIRFSGQASAHRLQEMHSVSPLSGLMLSRGAPRYRSPTLGLSAGYCSVYIRLGSWLRKVTQRPWKRSTRKTVRKSFEIIWVPRYRRGDGETRRHGESTRPALRVSASPCPRVPSPRVSSIHLAEHDIQRTNNRHDVGHQAAAHH